MAGRARVTAKDVAARAGVSQSTVSYVLNDAPNQTISEATRRRVREAAEELRYAPSAAARALRRGASQIVVIVLPDAPIGATMAELIEGVSDGLEPHGYSVVYRRHRGSAMLERAWREVMPAAVVNLAAFAAEDEARIEAAGIPLVRVPLGEGADEGLGVPEVMVGRVQATHLIERGHRRLGYAAPADERVSGFYARRLAGVREACASAGLPEPTVSVLALEVDAAADVVRAWRDADEPVTGVCAYNDEQAFALLAGMRVLGLTAPHDLAVVGVDDVPLAPFAFPPLTSVDIHAEGTAERLTRQLLDAVAGVPVEAWTAPRVTLVERESA